VARGVSCPANSPLREALGEFIRAAGLVRRIGVNLNQAVAKLSATGQRSGDLLPYAAACLRRADRLDTAAERIRQRLPWSRRSAVHAARGVARLLYYLFGPGRRRSTPNRTWSRDGETRSNWSRRCVPTAARVPSAQRAAAAAASRARPARI
jgi:hypothetical protein